MSQAALVPLTFEDSEAAADAVVEHGEIFTKRRVVELILDLAGYTSDRDLAKLTAIEPACGGGAFVGHMSQARPEIRSTSDSHHCPRRSLAVA